MQQIIKVRLVSIGNGHPSKPSFHLHERRVDKLKDIVIFSVKAQNAVMLRSDTWACRRHGYICMICSVLDFVWGEVDYQV